jgi:hypothetical protein
MANIASSLTYLNDVEISSDAPITQNLFTRIGSGVNYLNDRMQVIDPIISAMPDPSTILRRYPLIGQIVSATSGTLYRTAPGPWYQVDITLSWYSGATGSSAFGPYYSSSNISHLILSKYDFKKRQQYFTAYGHYYFAPLPTVKVEDPSEPYKYFQVIGEIKWDTENSIRIDFSGNVSYPTNYCQLDVVFHYAST